MQAGIKGEGAYTELPDSTLKNNNNNNSSNINNNNYAVTVQHAAAAVQQESAYDVMPDLQLSKGGKVEKKTGRKLKIKWTKRCHIARELESVTFLFFLKNANTLL